MANSSVATINPSDIITPAGFAESVELIRQTYAKDLNAEELSLFMADAHHRGLSIVKRQIYAAKYSGKMTIMVGIDGYRSQAESHPEYAGQDGPYYCGPDGQWSEIWLGGSDKPPVAAKVGIYRKGFAAPIYEIALWSEYNNTSNGMWKKFPTVMLAKCAEARAIRKAFPAQLGGTYIAEEMDQARRDAIETSGSVRPAQRESTPRQATATVSNPERDEASKALWDQAHNRYGWSKDTLDAVAVNETGKHLTELNAQGLRELTITITTNDPETLVAKATAIEAPQLAGMQP
jgi:phage recombination protein Bet